MSAVTDPKAFGKVAVLMGGRTGSRANAWNGIRPRCAAALGGADRGLSCAVKSRQGWLDEVSP